ncbi:hypothetical protein AB0N73_13200 [Microbacterium sp. NPDC089189]|uniref:hypothetical protein n=1 Tax=Microbacterium sp. NPDC089189 TaxID=3154972 RepID=UPI00343F097D
MLQFEPYDRAHAVADLAAAADDVQTARRLLEEVERGADDALAETAWSSPAMHAFRVQSAHWCADVVERCAALDALTDRIERARTELISRPGTTGGPT